eukprot:g31.t1
MRKKPFSPHDAPYEFCTVQYGTWFSTPHPTMSTACPPIIVVEDWGRRCTGGETDNVWLWIAENGIVEESCVPSGASVNGQVDPCPSTCKDGSPLVILTVLCAYA